MCDECQGKKATLECSECKRPYCQECAEDRDGACCVQTIEPMTENASKTKVSK